MRIDFNVLWVDDQPAAIQAQVARIARYMADQGFHFNPTLCHTMDELDGKLTENVFVDEVDMVLVDWDLGADAKGQDAIERIREKIRYKDVVFYSAQTAPNTLMDLVRAHDLEGVYCCTRTDLVNEVEGVFDSLIKKVLDLDHTRGIVMGATSDVDHMVNECLGTIHASLNNDGKEQFIATALAAVEKKLKELTKLGEKLKNQTEIAAFYKAHMLFTSMERLKLLKNALKTGGSHENPGAHASAVKYMDEVVPERNDLGHVVLVPEGKPSLVVNAAGNQVTLDDMRALRCTILEVRTEFRSLLQSLRG